MRMATNARNQQAPTNGVTLYAQDISTVARKQALMEAIEVLQSTPAAIKTNDYPYTKKMDALDYQKSALRTLHSMLTEGV